MRPAVSRVRQAAARFRGFARTLGDSRISMPGLTIGSGARVRVTMGGRISAGRACALAEQAVLHAEKGTIRIGSDVFVGIGTIIVALDEIVIGDDTLIAEYVTIRDQDHRIGGGKVRQDGFVTAPIRIGRNVWIGAKATITKGVTVGDNAVIAANAVVTHDVPADAVVAGVPARTVRQG